MSNSKHLSPFVFDVLCYLNRDQLERFSIVCRSLKNIIERYFHSKPYRIFDFLVIHGGSYALFHQGWQWHPNRDDYSVQQFLGGEACSNVYSRRYYSFAEMRPYLGPNIRIENTSIYADAFAYNPNRIAEMESITYLWRNGKVSVQNYVISIFNNIEEYSRRIGAEDFLPILNSPTILQCRYLRMFNAEFSFKDYKVLYSAKVIEIAHIIGDMDLNHLLDFLDQPGVKPVVVLLYRHRSFIDNVIERLSKLTEFRETNKTSGEILELKKGVPIECQHRFHPYYEYYTLERSSI